MVSNCGNDTLARVSELLNISIVDDISTMRCMLFICRLKELVVIDADTCVGTCGLAISREIKNIPVFYKNSTDGPSVFLLLSSLFLDGHLSGSKVFMY